MTSQTAPGTPAPLRYGIIIANTGTPTAPTPDAIRVYLRQMLMDPYLINCPRPIWKPILERFILPTRPERTAPRYRSIWTPEGSPFMLDSLAQQRLLQIELARRGLDVPVELGMRYGEPSLATAADRLIERGCNAALLIPLFPQQAQVTTASCIEEFERAVATRPLAETRTVTRYCDRPAYIRALADSIRQAARLRPGSKLLFTYHSTLVKDIERGDPYNAQCWETARLTAQELGLNGSDWTCSFHSRFDSRKWVGPEADVVLTQWANEGVNDVAVVSPSFAADCLETLVDIAIEQRGLFLEAHRAAHPDGPAASFTYVPCLGRRSDHIALLADVATDALADRLADARVSEEKTALDLIEQAAAC